MNLEKWHVHPICPKMQSWPFLFCCNLSYSLTLNPLPEYSRTTGKVPAWDTAIHWAQVLSVYVPWGGMVPVVTVLFKRCRINYVNPGGAIFLGNDSNYIFANLATWNMLFVEGICIIINWPVHILRRTPLYMHTHEWWIQINYLIYCILSNAIWA